MHLAATVFCNCFEKGRLREPPPVGCHLGIAGDGSLLCGSGDLFVQAAFAHWLRGHACDHKDGRLIQCSLGELAEISVVRAILQETPGRYPLILSRAVCSGNTDGTLITPDELPALRAEVMALGDVHHPHRDTERIIRVFESRVVDLVDCALLAGKPIAFEQTRNTV